MLGQSSHLVVIGLCGDISFMRMQAGAGENPIMLLGDFQGTVVRARPRAAANRENTLQSCFPRAGKHLGAIGIKLVAFNVSVRINVQAFLLAADLMYDAIPLRHHAFLNWLLPTNEYEKIAGLISE